MSYKSYLFCLMSLCCSLFLAGCGKDDGNFVQDSISSEATQSVQSSETQEGKPADSAEDLFWSRQEAEKESSEELSSERSSTPQNTENCAILVDYASALMYYNPDSYHMCVLDNSAYATQIGFEAMETVTDVSILRLAAVEIPESGDILFSEENVYSLPELTPEMPLVVSASFGESIPTLGISFLDANQERQVYGVLMSGEDQSILLQEIVLAE